MPGAIPAGQVDDIERADDIGVDIIGRMVKAVAHAGLGAEMQHDLRLVALEHRLHGRCILNADAVHAETFKRSEARRGLPSVWDRNRV